MQSCVIEVHQKSLDPDCVRSEPGMDDWKR
jgi:hypothetical protein